MLSIISADGKLKVLPYVHDCYLSSGLDSAVVSFPEPAVLSGLN